LADLAAPVLATEEVADERPAPAGRRRRRLRLTFWLASAWMALITGVAVLANVLPLDPPNQVLVGPPFSPPSWQFLLGTDELGRNELSRIVYGARVSLVVGFAAVAIGLVIGGTLGLIAGYYGGKLDALISAGANVLLAFPAIIFAVAIVSFLGPSLLVVVLVLGVVAIAPMTRLVRASTASYARRDFVLAAEMMGYAKRRILWREILPNVVPSALSFALIGVAVAIVAEGALSFLGLSIRPPDPSWGNMIAEGNQYLSRDPWLVICPSLALFLTVLSLNVVGDALRAVFDVKESAL